MENPNRSKEDEVAIQVLREMIISMTTDSLRFGCINMS